VKRDQRDIQYISIHHEFIILHVTNIDETSEWKQCKLDRICADIWHSHTVTLVLDSVQINKVTSISVPSAHSRIKEEWGKYQKMCYSPVSITLCWSLTNVALGHKIGASKIYIHCYLWQVSHIIGITFLPTFCAYTNPNFVAFELLLATVVFLIVTNYLC